MSCVFFIFIFSDITARCSSGIGNGTSPTGNIFVVVVSSLFKTLLSSVAAGDPCLF